MNRRLVATTKRVALFGTEGMKYLITRNEDIVQCIKDLTKLIGYFIAIFAMLYRVLEWLLL